MDFVSDELANGRRLRCLTIVDDCTRECLAIEVDTSLPGTRGALDPADVGNDGSLPGTLAGSRQRRPQHGNSSQTVSRPSLRDRAATAEFSKRDWLSPRLPPIIPTVR